MGFLALLWFSEICQFSHRFSGPWEYSSSSVFFKDHPFFAVHALCVFAVWVRQTHVPPPQGGFIRLVALQGVAVVLFRCAVGVGACPGGLLLITGSDWSATCAFRRHGIQEIGLPPARWGASPTCRWPHTSATPRSLVDSTRGSVRSLF